MKANGLHVTYVGYSFKLIFSVILYKRSH